MQIKKEVIKKAVEITSSYEGGYTALAGNTDGQYLSMGFLCWNFGQGTLQPLLKRLFDEYPQVAADKLIAKGIWLKQALMDGYEKEWAMLIQEDNEIIDLWKASFNNLCNTPEFRTIQDEAVKPYLDKAEKMCNDWQLETDRAFCLAFDIAVQNGSLNYYPMAEVDYRDKLRSWVEVVVSRTDEKWKYVVRQRKEAILNGSGIVYSEMKTFVFNDQTMYEVPIIDLHVEIEKWKFEAENWKDRYFKLVSEIKAIYEKYEI